MNKYIIILMILFNTSCCGLHTEVDYDFKGIVIKRIDECGITSFYYKNVSNETGRIWVTYSGINDGFSAYLKFEDNGLVKLISGEGHFQNENLDSSKFEFKRISSYERPILGESVYYLTLSTRYEIERNANTGTKILAKYKIDKNEWW